MDRIVDVLQSQRGLAALGFGMVVVFTSLILSRRASVLTALILTAVGFGLLSGYGPQLGSFAADGVRQIAPTVVMITFAVLYFSLMLDAGLFDPLITIILRLTGESPQRIALGTAAMALIVAFSGDGVSTALILIAAFLPLYRRVGMDAAVLGCLIFIAVAVQNLSPWGGPTARAGASLGVDPAAIYLTLLPTVAIGGGALLAVAAVLGWKERRRIAGIGLAEDAAPMDVEAGEALVRDDTARRPERFTINLVLTLALLGGLVGGLAPPLLLFPTAAALALLINYPTLREQRERIATHADNLASFMIIFFAAGLFTGVLTGSGMIEAMAGATVAALPESLGRSLGPVTALLSLPMTYVMPNDAFFFGVLPVIAKTSAAFGLTTEQVAAASVLGQPVHVFSPLLPSLYVLCSLLGVDVGRFLRFSLPWAALVSLTMIAGALLTGVVPLIA